MGLPGPKFGKQCGPTSAAPTANSVESGSILDGEVATADLAAKAVTAAKLNADVITTSSGLSGADGAAIAFDPNGCTAADVAVASDSIVIIDANATPANSPRKESIADVITAVAGEGLLATSGVISVDLDGHGDATIDVAADTIPFVDESAAGDPTKLESVVDFVGAIADGTTISASSGVMSVKNAGVSKTKLAGGFSKITLAAGTTSGADVTVSGMAVGDELVSVLSFTTAAAIATVADRTSEYVVAAGKLTKAAGTVETSNQLIIFWNDLT